MCYLYILKSLKDGSFYVGSTRDLQDRIKKHRQGAVRFTKSRLPVILLYTEKYTKFSEAYKREKQIKGWKKRRAIEKLIKQNGPIV